MIREMTAQDEKRYLDMGQEFYSSNAVLHPIPREIYHKNFQEILQGSPYIKGYIIEKDGQTAGYMILSFTYSSEVGGMVVLIEELFLHENFRLKQLFLPLLPDCFPSVRRTLPMLPPAHGLH